MRTEISNAERENGGISNMYSFEKLILINRLRFWCIEILVEEMEFQNEMEFNVNHFAIEHEYHYY